MFVHFDLWKSSFGWLYIVWYVFIDPFFGGEVAMINIELVFNIFPLQLVLVYIGSIIGLYKLDAPCNHVFG